MTAAWKDSSRASAGLENGATGVLRQTLAPEWKPYTVRAKPESGATEFTRHIYSIGGGTLYLDDVSLVPVGAKLD